MPLQAGHGPRPPSPLTIIESAQNIMRFNVAVTLPINPPSSPVLTRAQVWKALKLKSRDPVRFLPVITSCKVLEENVGGLTRIVNFKPETGPPGDVTEVVTFYEGVKVS